MDLEIGTVVDRYTVERVLGRGGMATVYTVRHNTLETRHALKVLHVAALQVQSRLIQEGKVQARLRHPNIVAVTDVLEIQGAPGLLMELITGPALDQWLAEHRPSPWEAEVLFRGILSGVAHAHALDVIHRDLKPGNVLLASDKDGWVPKITDFGLSKILVDSTMSFGTRTGLPMGTPAYMAPEQISDASRVDHRADIFSLGCILYELVTGKNAFVGKDTLDTFNRVARGDCTPVRDLAPDAPERVVRTIAGCLVVDRERRIPDCATILRSLDGEEVREVPANVQSVETFDLTSGMLESPGLPAPRGGAGGWGGRSAAAAVPQDGVRRPPPRLAPPAPALPPPADNLTGSIVPRSPPPGASGDALRGGSLPASLDPLSVTSQEAGASLRRLALVVLAVVGVALVVGVGVLVRWMSPGAEEEPVLQPVAPVVDVEAPVPEAPADPAPTPRGTAPRVAPTPRVETPPPVEAPAVVEAPVEAPTPVVVEALAPTGRVEVTGDATSVRLVDRAGNRHSPGVVPVGTYDLEATFATGVTIRRAGLVKVRTDQAVRVRCAAVMENCQ